MSNDNVISLQSKKDEKIEDEAVAPINEDDYERYSIIQSGVFSILMRFQDLGYFPDAEDIDKVTFGYDVFFATLAIASIISREHDIHTEIHDYAEEILSLESPEKFNEVFQKFIENMRGGNPTPSNDG